MKKLLIILIMSVFSAFLFVPTGFSYEINGQVNDWGVDLSSAVTVGDLDTDLPSGGNDIDYITEDNAAEGSWYKVWPGWSQGNLYDAEAMYFDNDGKYGYIAIITGTPTNAEYEPGDIAIDTDATNTGYEYGIDIIHPIPSSSGGLYSVSKWYDVEIFHDADPWTIENGTLKNFCPLVYSTIADSGHYVIETKFLLSDLELAVGDIFNIHWTMECGNDVLNLVADVNPVPEADTMLLLGFGLISLVGIGRTRFRLRGKRD